ncbi:hypothetical protein JHK87_039861 [Glycine soja]|nr:hypothetical protein JHK87_039861 [Glycine soja]
MGIGRNAKEGLWFVGDAPTMLLLSNNEKDNKNKEKGKSEKEKVVKIIGGRDAGLKGSVVSRTIDGYLVLELSRSGEKVKVKELKTECEDKVSMSKRGKDEVEEKREDV